MKRIYLKNSGDITPLDIMHHIGDIKSGLFSVKDRWKRLFPEYEIILVYDEFDENYDVLIDGAFIPFEKIDENTDVVFDNKLVIKWKNPKREKSISGIYCNYLYQFMLNNAKIMEFDIKLKDLYGYKRDGEIYIHTLAKVSKETILIDTEGPIVIDENVNVRYFSVIEGPIYIGKNTLIERATLHGGTYIGKVNKLSGEIEESIFMDYVNKHHYGFIGHSVIGEWVNLGAGTTNSDLKNNYSSVRLQHEDTVVDTNSLKIGCFIGDHTKTAIGTMINTGTIIGAFSNVFGYNVMPKYIKPFSWGTDGKYDIDKLIDTVKRVMERRDIVPTDEYIKRIRKAWK